MTKEEILKIKEHIKIHARREPRAVKITEIMWKAVDELEHIAELEKENKVLRRQQTNAVLNGLEMKVLKDSHRDRANKTQDQLTKAKELLKKIEKIVYSGENELKRLSKIVDILAEAEQFIKE